MPKRLNPAIALKQMVCSRCQSSVKLPVDRYCKDCALDIQIRKERPELTAAGNWRLRTAASREASYKAKRRKSLFAKLGRLDYRIAFLYAQKKRTPEHCKVFDEKISKLLYKRKKTSEAYDALLKEPAPAFNEQSEGKQPEDKREIAIKSLQAIITCAKKMADDERRYQDVL